MPSVSVVIPVFNSEKYLVDCVQSVLNQSFKDFELILVDDGSTDSSGIVCDNLLKTDDRIVVVHKPNGGQSTARNLGVSIAKSDWICFVDNDDVIHPDMLRALYMAIRDTNALIATSGHVEAKEIPIDFFEEKKYTYSRMVIDEDALLKYRDESIHYWCVFGILINKQLVLKNPMEENKSYEDNAIACQWLCSAHVVADSKTPYYFYRMNSDGITKGKYNVKRLDMLWSREVQINYFKQMRYFRLVDVTCFDYFDLARWQFNQLKKYHYEPSIIFSVKKRTKKLLFYNYKYLSISSKLNYLKNWKPKLFSFLRLQKLTH